MSNPKTRKFLTTTLAIASAIFGSQSPAQTPPVTEQAQIAPEQLSPSDFVIAPATGLGAQMNGHQSHSSHASHESHSSHESHASHSSHSSHQSYAG
jgi:hypothetical protein